VKSPQDTVPFHSVYTVTDSSGGLCVIPIVFAILVFLRAELPFRPPGQTTFRPTSWTTHGREIVTEMVLPAVLRICARDGQPRRLDLPVRLAHRAVFVPWLEPEPRAQRAVRPIYAADGGW